MIKTFTATVCHEKMRSEMNKTFTVTVYHAELAAIASEFGEDYFYDLLRNPSINAIRFLFENGFYARKARVTVRLPKSELVSQYRILDLAFISTNSLVVEYDWAENEEVELLARAGNRSSAPGDIFLMDHTGEYFLCTTDSWKSLPLNN